MQPKKRETLFTRLRDEDPLALKAIAARGGIMRTALHGRDANLSKARAVQRAKMLARIDPEGILPPEELALRINAVYRARAVKAREGLRQKRLREAAARAAAENASGAA